MASKIKKPSRRAVTFARRLHDAAWKWLHAIDRLTTVTDAGNGGGPVLEFVLRMMNPLLPSGSCGPVRFTAGRRVGDVSTFVSFLAGPGVWDLVLRDVVRFYEREFHPEMRRLSEEQTEGLLSASDRRWMNTLRGAEQQYDDAEREMASVLRLVSAKEWTEAS